MAVQGLQSVVENIEVGHHSLTVSDARAPDMPLVYVSPGFLAFCGYQREQVLGRNCRFLQGHMSNQPGVVAIREAIRTQSECIVDLINFRQDGSSLRNRLSLHPIFDAAGKLTYYVGLQSDLSSVWAMRDRLMAHFSALGSNA